MSLDYKEEVYNITTGKYGIHSVYNYTDKHNPLIIIPPQFEKTIRTNLVPMLYLINNGFNVFRFDNTFHNGNSYGAIEFYNLGNALSDLENVIDFIRDSPEIVSNKGLGILGISIFSRVILKYLSINTDTFDIFLSLNGVINMQKTLQAILGYDYVDEFQHNPSIKYGTRIILNDPVNWEHFLQTLIDEDMHDLMSTKIDISKIRNSIFLILGEKDKLVPSEDYDEVFSNNPAILKGIYTIPDGGHELYKNTKAAGLAFEAIVEIFKKFWGRKDGEIIKPNIVAIIEGNNNERNRELKFTEFLEPCCKEAERL